MGIKVFEFLRRKAGTSAAEFHRSWREVHGPLLADDPDLRRHVTRYELNHRLPSDADRPRSSSEVADQGWDGVAVLWFDSPDAMRALSAEPAMAVIRERSGEFREDARLIVVTEDPQTIVDDPRREQASAKLICILRRHAALELDAFHEHWSNTHGGLYQTVPALRDPLYGYDQNHGLRDPSAAFDGVTEQWFDSLEAFVESLNEPEVPDLVNPDVAFLLDAPSTHFVMTGRPTVLVG